jgi:hypothetical protein
MHIPFCHLLFKRQPKLIPLAAMQVDDIKVKMQAAFEPYKAALRSSAGATRSQIELKESPEAIQQLQAFGETLRRVLN